VDSSYIKNLIAGKISVGELLAGDIILGTEDNDEGGIRILSKNGNMVMNGQVL